jgi:hypothetical protein
MVAAPCSDPLGGEHPPNPAADTFAAVARNQTQELRCFRKNQMAGRPPESRGFGPPSTGRDAYVWNNAEGDGPGLWRPSMKSWVDRTSYDPNPPEGAVLVRTGEKLSPAVRAASGW